MNVPRFVVRLNFLVVGAALAGPVVAGEARIQDVKPDGFSSRWRVGIGFAPLLGADVKFGGLGAFSSPFQPQAPGGGQNYQYDDGFVGVDASGNAGGLTSNWGYSNDQQYSAANGGSLDFSISNSLANGSVEDSDDFSPGLELFGELELGEIPKLSLGGRPAVWGVRVGFSYADIGFENRSALSSDVRRTTDTFALDGVIPPLAPYTGSATGPGPLISDSPSRAVSLIRGGATVTGSRELDVDLFGISAGPYIDWAITKNFYLGCEAGLSIALANGDYEFASSTSVAGLGSQQSSGSASETDLLPGVYFGLRANHALSEQWGLYASARYQLYDDFEVRAGGSEATLSFDGTFVAAFGATFSF